MEIGVKRPDRWAIILAGGEGMRLRSLTRRIAGDERPKQFCPFVDGQTLLGRTARSGPPHRAPDRTCLVLTRTPRAVLCAAPRGGATRASGRPAVRPGHRSRDSLRALSHPEVAPWPRSRSSPRTTTCRTMRVSWPMWRRLCRGEARPDLIVLLGMGRRARGAVRLDRGGRPAARRPAYPVYRVRRFWRSHAGPGGDALQRGCLWNTFVLVAGVPALLALIRAAAPDLYGAFMTAWRGRSTLGEGEAMRSLYARRSVDEFSGPCWARRPPNSRCCRCGSHVERLGEPARVSARWNGWASGRGGPSQRPRRSSSRREAR